MSDRRNRKSARDRQQVHAVYANTAKMTMTGNKQLEWQANGLHEILSAEEVGAGDGRIGETGPLTEYEARDVSVCDGLKDALLFGVPGDGSRRRKQEQDSRRARVQYLLFDNQVSSDSASARRAIVVASNGVCRPISCIRWLRHR